MNGRAAWLANAARIRTIGFIFAMIPMMLVVGMLVMFCLLLLTPLMIYSAITGKHFKDPWRKHRIFWE